MSLIARHRCIFSKGFGSMLMLGLLSGCFTSPLSNRFSQGAQKQDGLNTMSLELFERSPYHAASEQIVFADERLDRSIPKTTHFFSGITNSRDRLGGDWIKVRYSYEDAGRPSFFTWAGQNVLWQDNKDYRAFFGYFYTHRAIDFADELFTDLTSATRLGLVDSDDFAWDDHMKDGSGDTIAAKVLPVTISVDNDSTVGGANSVLTDTHFCPIFNDNYKSNGSGSCIGFSVFDEMTPKEIEDAFHGPNAYLSKRINFFEDVNLSSLSAVDDSDVISHEVFHLVQDAILPEVMGSDLSANDQIQSIIEGTADFFVAAVNRKPQMKRYYYYNFERLYPWAFAGSFDGSVRDVNNTLYFPNAYMSAPQIEGQAEIHDNGRVVAGLFFDVVMAASGNTVRTFGHKSSCPFGSAASCDVQMANLTGTSAYDAAAHLMILALKKLSEDPDKLNVGFSGFSNHLEDACEDLSVWCNKLDLVKLMAGRGLRTPFRWGRDYEQLNELGSTVGSKGIVLDATNLGWVPFMPGGITDFANSDDKIDPCEAIYVYPDIQNKSNVEAFNSIPGWSATSAEYKGAPIFELGYTITDGPLGFQNFQHPEFGYPEPWAGVSKVKTKGVPVLAPGESITSLWADDSRLFEIYKNSLFDNSQEQMGAASKAVHFQNHLGWLFQAPDEAGDEMFLKFEGSYRAFDKDDISTLYTFSGQRKLTVDETSNNFCE